MDISYPVSHHQSFKLENLNQTSDVYYKTYGKLIEHMKQNSITKEETSTDIEIHQDQITKRIVKRKQEYEDDTKNSRKLPATGILALQIVLTQACNQQFIGISQRQASYATWPQDIPLPSVDDIVRAGFFYSGKKTIVTCFYCNGSLQNWAEKDNPMIEHVRWFPQCPYARQLCGDDLYQKIQQLKWIAQQANSQQQISTEVSLSLPNVNPTIRNNSSSNLLSIPDESTLSRFVAARLDLPVSQRMLDKFRLSIIKRCYEDQLRLKLEDFVSDNDLYMACLILQKQIEVIDGKKENIIIPSKHLQEITEKNKREVIIDQTHLTMKQDETEEMVTSTVADNVDKNGLPKHMIECRELLLKEWMKKWTQTDINVDHISEISCIRVTSAYLALSIHSDKNIWRLCLFNRTNMQPIYDIQIGQRVDTGIVCMFSALTERKWITTNVRLEKMTLIDDDTTKSYIRKIGSNGTVFGNKYLVIRTANGLKIYEIQKTITSSVIKIFFF
ncbi:unnamed protein product [Didymodactylos carnosus]|uniref:Uncharacterized protein n=2 Tax=Didymodactylos carnosus TaxID=1234261 RepID=A0A8S2CM52_9BILA|nr:unnamed protein product [Didymodactylos carnosus]CAF3521476.1 unnamed protein product [Didymodactylos carnosus]